MNSGCVVERCFDARDNCNKHSKSLSFFDEEFLTVLNIVIHSTTHFITEKEVCILFQSVLRIFSSMKFMHLLG